MSRLPASYLPAVSRRRTPSRPNPSQTSYTPLTQPAHIKPARDEPDFTPVPNRLWLVFLLGVIAGAAVLASQVSTFLYG